MKKHSLVRRLLTLVLALVLTAGLAMPVFAAEEDADDNGYEYENGYEDNGDEDAYDNGDEEDAEDEDYDAEDADEDADEDYDDEDVAEEPEETFVPITDTIVHTLTVEVDGVEVSFADQGPINVGGTVFVPVRGVFEHMGFTAAWSGSARTATLTGGGGVVVVIPADGTTFTVNGEVITPPAPQHMLNGRVMLPLRAVAEALGATPAWCPDTLTASITTAADEPVPADDPVDYDEEDADYDEEDADDEEDEDYDEEYDNGEEQDEDEECEDEECDEEEDDEEEEE